MTAGPSAQWVTIRLSTEHRACVLRAILARRNELRDTIDRLDALGRDDTRVEIRAARVELECLQAATVNLWASA